MPKNSGSPKVHSAKAGSTTEILTLARKVTKCRACILRRGCSGPLGGVGMAGARVMVVEQAPNWEDDKEQAGYVGVTGQLVVQSLVRHGLEYSDLYLTHLVKCWPNQTKGKKGGVPPMALEKCQGYLEKEYALVKPQVIVALGETVMRFFGVKGGVRQNNGKLHRTEWGPVITILAPGSLFKNPGDLPQFNTQLTAVVTFLNGATIPPPHSDENDWDLEMYLADRD